MARLTGKVALVTGAARGIGAAIAKRLGADGAMVAITFSSSPQKAQEVVAEIQNGGGKAIAIQADAADPAAIKHAIEQTVSQLGGLDILVNNAGIHVPGKIGEISPEPFEKMLATNVRGLFYATHEAVKHLRNDGRVINIGSVNSESVPFPGESVYALTKGAVAGFTHGLARDLGPRGITVNNIQPGPINTDLNPASGPAAEMLKGFMAVKRFGKAEEIAGLVSFLAGPEGAFITGAGFKIDGGFCA